MCAGLAYLLINKVEEVWLMIFENVSQNEKLTLLLDYYIQQLMGEPECSHRDVEYK
jgi:hypothetical protein